MDYRILTVSREYGSGGAQIAALVAERLGWKLLDSAVITEIARAAQVDPEMVRACDERVDSWLHRVGRQCLWYGGFDAVTVVAAEQIFDGETMVKFTRALIEDAYKAGGCVIVGRGAQCILQDRKDAFHVFVYAPWTERMKRARALAPQEPDLARFIRNMDEERAAYVRMHYSQDWADRHLYDLMINSKPGLECAVSAILCAMGAGCAGTAGEPG